MANNIDNSDNNSCIIDDKMLALIAELHRGNLSRILMSIHTIGNSRRNRYEAYQLYIDCERVIKSDDIYNVAERRRIYENVCKYRLFSAEQKTNLWREEFTD
jgi:hypothetical protein